jgi:hypothetical protein
LLKRKESERSDKKRIARAVTQPSNRADVRREAFSPTEVRVPWGPPGQVRFPRLSRGVEECFDA